MVQVPTLCSAHMQVVAAKEAVVAAREEVQQETAAFIAAVAEEDMMEGKDKDMLQANVQVVCVCGGGCSRVIG